MGFLCRQHSYLQCILHGKSRWLIGWKICVGRYVVRREARDHASGSGYGERSPLHASRQIHVSGCHHVEVALPDTLSLEARHDVGLMLSDHRLLHKVAVRVGEVLHRDAKPVLLRSA